MPLRGARETAENLRRIAREVEQAQLAGVREYGTIELKEMKRLTPHDTYRLMNSGHIEGPERIDHRIKMMFIFDTEYAVYVHEDLDAIHPYGQAKFVEQPLNESAPYLLPRVAESMRRRLGL